MPESISSKIIVLLCIAASSTTFIANRNLDNSPPDAILFIGSMSLLEFVEARNVTLSIPNIEASSMATLSKFIERRALSNFS